MLAGMQRAIAGLASVGNNIIVDENAIYEGQLEGYFEVLREFEVLFVGVRCTLDEVERRERKRGDRRSGHAKGHYHLTHALVDAHGSYDLDIDSSLATPLECALLIKDYMESDPTPTAFHNLSDILAKDLSKRFT